jgi:hypothetical protein
MKVPEDFPTIYDQTNEEDVRDWFAAHELVDLSLCGPQCPACGDVDEDGWTWCMVEQHAVYVGGPCPVLAARKETT